MPILDVQVRMRELGRIRTGNQVPAGNGRRRPAKLETFRITSGSKDLIDAAAATYGGEARPWESPAGNQWEVITTVDALPIVVPPGEALSQWYELWSGGGCQRRCDGRTEYITEQPCLCPADPADRRDAAQAGEACKPTTRLGVMLPELPDLGIWRLESHGFYAAVELAGAARFLAIASASGLNVPARLRLDQREKKVPGKPTNRYAVPVIEFTSMRITDLLAASRTGQPLALDGVAAPQLPAGDVPVAPVTPPPAAQAPRPSTPAQARRLRADRPPLGQAPGVPDGSDFRKPTPTATAAPDPTQAPSAAEPEAPAAAAPAEEAENLGGWAIEEPAAAPPAAVADVHPLVEQIRAASAAGTAKGPMSPEQKAAVFERIVTPVGAGTFKTVVVRAIGEDAFTKPSAREAAALLTVADGFVDEAELVRVWRSSAAAIAGPPS